MTYLEIKFISYNIYPQGFTMYLTIIYILWYLYI